MESTASDGLVNLRRLNERDQNTLIIVLVTSIFGGILATLVIRCLWKLAFKYDKDPVIHQNQDLGLPPPPGFPGHPYYSGNMTSPTARSRLRSDVRSMRSGRSRRSRESRASRRRDRDRDRDRDREYYRDQDRYSPGNVQFRDAHDSHRYDREYDDDDDEEGDYSGSDYDSQAGPEEVNEFTRAQSARTAWQQDFAQVAANAGHYGQLPLNGNAQPLQPLNREASRASLQSTGSFANRNSSGTPKLFGFSIKNLFAGPNSQRNSFRSNGDSFRARAQGPPSNANAVDRTASFSNSNSLSRAPSSPGQHKRQSGGILGGFFKWMSGDPDLNRNSFRNSSRLPQQPPSRGSNTDQQRFHLVATNSFVTPTSGSFRAPFPLHPQQSIGAQQPPNAMLGNRGLLQPPTPSSQMPSQPASNPSFLGQGSGRHMGAQGSFGQESMYSGPLSHGPSRDWSSSFSNTPTHSTQPTPNHAAFLHHSAFQGTAARNNFSPSFRQTTRVDQQGLLIGPDGNIKFVPPGGHSSASASGSSSFTPRQPTVAQSPSRSEPPSEINRGFSVHTAFSQSPTARQPPAQIARAPSGGQPPPRMQRGHAPPAINVPGGVPGAGDMDGRPQSTRVFGISMRQFGIQP